jgi:hypothetical protein
MTKLKLVYNGRFFHINIMGDKISKFIKHGKEIFLPYCIAHNIIGMKKISKKTIH